MRKKGKQNLEVHQTLKTSFYAKASQQTDAIIVDPYFFFFEKFEFFVPSSKKITPGFNQKIKNVVDCTAV